MRKPFLRSVEFLSPRTGTFERNEQAALPTGTLQSLTRRSACSRLALLNFCATVWFARFNTTSKASLFRWGTFNRKNRKRVPSGALKPCANEQLSEKTSNQFALKQNGLLPECLRSTVAATVRFVNKTRDAPVHQLIDFNCREMCIIVL